MRRAQAAGVPNGTVEVVLEDAETATGQWANLVELIVLTELALAASVGAPPARLVFSVYILGY